MMAEHDDSHRTCDTCGGPQTVNRTVHEDTPSGLVARAEIWACENKECPYVINWLMLEQPNLEQPNPVPAEATVHFARKGHGIEISHMVTAGVAGGPDGGEWLVTADSP